MAKSINCSPTYTAVTRVSHTPVMLTVMAAEVRNEAGLMVETENGGGVTGAVAEDDDGEDVREED